MRADKFNEICRNIKQLKVQGARDVAKAAVKALKYKHDKRAIKKLVSLRPTEPALRNAIKFVLEKPDLNKGISLALKHFQDATEKISIIGSRLIKNNSIVFTHCHSDTVAALLIKAKKQGKNFEVRCTETRPLYQGRLMAQQLAKAKIPVTLYVDSAARLALKKADIAIYGCDALTTTKIYNKIGSELFALIARQYEVPLYIATDSWKFDSQSIYGAEEKIEQRSSKEIWEKPPKGIKILNPAFERIDPNLTTGIITELGLFKLGSLVQEIKKIYPFIFKR